jgi:hypothetical protein
MESISSGAGRSSLTPRAITAMVMDDRLNRKLFPPLDMGSLIPWYFSA